MGLGGIWDCVWSEFHTKYKEFSFESQVDWSKFNICSSQTHAPYIYIRVWDSLWDSLEGLMIEGTATGCSGRASFAGWRKSLRSCKDRLLGGTARRAECGTTLVTLALRRPQGGHERETVILTPIFILPQPHSHIQLYESL